MQLLVDKARTFALRGRKSHGSAFLQIVSVSSSIYSLDVPDVVASPSILLYLSRHASISAAIFPWMLIEESETIQSPNTNKQKRREINVCNEVICRTDFPLSTVLCKHGYIRVFRHLFEQAVDLPPLLHVLCSCFRVLKPVLSCQLPHGIFSVAPYFS